jgi:hypothetical protein
MNVYVCVRARPACVVFVIASEKQRGSGREFLRSHTTHTTHTQERARVWCVCVGSAA